MRDDLDAQYGPGAEEAFSLGVLRDEILEEILHERERQASLAHGGDTEEFDKQNSKNDWIAYVTAYVGRAAEKVRRNEREGQEFKENMVKVGALVLAAVEAYERRWC